MTATACLFYRRGIYDLPPTDALFAAALRENVAGHAQRCGQYAEILRRRGFSPDELKSISDIARLPPLTTLYLKRHTLFSSPEKQLKFKSTTSGTSGRVSVMGLDFPTLFYGTGMVLGTFFRNRIPSIYPTNYIILGYQPAKRNKIGAVKTAYAATLAAPAVHREYALKDDGEKYTLNLDGLRQRLIKYEKQGFPVRFMGFPAYFMFLLRELEQNGIRLRLHPKSLVMLHGGWKQFWEQRVEKEELYETSRRVLGIGGGQIREFFGAVEHPIAYCDCENHHFHVPIYSRVIIRGTKTLEPVPYGDAGFLNLLTPMVTSHPLSSVMTDDMAILHPPGSCGCGIDSPWFEVLGRVGLTDVKTCAADAASLLADLILPTR
jgi:phenylacetate-coenzyme A ligase PaaK-like adenylate-forming protein